MASATHQQFPKMMRRLDIWCCWSHLMRYFCVHGVGRRVSRGNCWCLLMPLLMPFSPKKIDGAHCTFKHHIWCQNFRGISISNSSVRYQQIPQRERADFFLNFQGGLAKNKIRGRTWKNEKSGALSPSGILLMNYWWITDGNSPKSPAPCMVLESTNRAKKYFRWKWHQ